MAELSARVSPAELQQLWRQTPRPKAVKGGARQGKPVTWPDDWPWPPAITLRWVRLGVDAQGQLVRLGYEETE